MYSCIFSCALDTTPLTDTENIAVWVLVSFLDVSNSTPIYKDSATFAYKGMNSYILPENFKFPLNLRIFFDVKTWFFVLKAVPVSRIFSTVYFEVTCIPFKVCKNNLHFVTFLYI